MGKEQDFMFEKIDEIYFSLQEQSSKLMPIHKLFIKHLLLVSNALREIEMILCGEIEKTQEGNCVKFALEYDYREEIKIFEKYQNN